MPVMCGVCRLPCEDTNKLIMCSDNCGSGLHFDCAPTKTRGAKKDWTCETCRPEKASSLSSNKSATISSVSKEFLISTMETFKNEIMAEFKKFSSENAELRSSLQFLSDAADKSNKLMEELQKQLKKIQQENLQLNKENSELRESVVNLEVRIRNVEQHSRRQNIEIDGIPHTPGENIKKILQDVAGAIGVEYKEDVVVAAHRVPSFNKHRTQPIIVRLSNYSDRDNWITKFKAVRPLTASSVNSSFSNTVKVFINEHLSPENKQLLGKVKEAAKAKNYKYAWCRDGKMFVRRDDGEKCIRIDHLLDLNKL